MQARKSNFKFKIKRNKKKKRKLREKGNKTRKNQKFPSAHAQ